MFLLGYFFFFFFLSYSCNVLGAYNELNKVRLAEESNVLWQQKHGLFLVTVSGEESSSSSCSSMPWCMAVSCSRLLLPGELLGKGVMCVAVQAWLCLASSPALGGNWGSPGLCVTSPRLCQTVLPWQLQWLLPCLGRLPREAGDAQWDTRSQDMARHLPRSSLWGPCLGKLVMFGSLLQSPAPAVNSIKAMLGKGGINYSR